MSLPSEPHRKNTSKKAFPTRDKKEAYRRQLKAKGRSDRFQTLLQTRTREQQALHSILSFKRKYEPLRAGGGFLRLLLQHFRPLCKRGPGKTRRTALKRRSRRLRLGVADQQRKSIRRKRIRVEKHGPSRNEVHAFTLGSSLFLAGDMLYIVDIACRETWWGCEQKPALKGVKRR